MAGDNGRDGQVESLLISELQPDDTSTGPRPLQAPVDTNNASNEILILGELEKLLLPNEEAEETKVDVSTDYRDSWPHVEVTVAVMEVTRFGLVEMSFDAELEIYLNWKDPQLCRGVHYEYIGERGAFEMIDALKTCKDDMRLFNPKITITNSHTLPEEVDVFPRIIDEVTEGADDEERDIPCLSKKFRFAGAVSCRHINARTFPFDINCLYVKFSCPDMNGLTSHGRVRRIKISDPVLAMNRRLRKQRGSGRSHFAAARLPDGRPVVMPHMWRIDPDGGDTHKIGEMRVIAIGGSAGLTGMSYSFAMVLRRQWYPRYFFDFLIYNLQTVTAIFSLWVPFNDDMLTQRMSITLTVLLTVVGVSTTRPPVIEKLPYTTLHDSYGQLMVFSVLLIGLGNLVIFTNCWGMYRDGLDFFDEALQLEIFNFREDGILGKWWCQEGSGLLGCGASNLDCMVMVFTFCSLILLFLVVFGSSQMSRIDRVLRVKHELDTHGAPILVESRDGISEPFSKLVMCTERGEFMFLPRLDVLTYARSVALVPGVWFFWLSWRWCRMFCKCCCCQRKLLDLDQDGNDDDTFYPIEAVRLLEKNERAYSENGEQKPSINKFPVKILPWDTLRVLDIGSGEMGFYSYWLDKQSRRVKAGGTDGKLKYDKGMTFVDQFLESDDGEERLKKEIVDRFELPRLERKDVSFSSIEVPEEEKHIFPMTPEGSPQHMTILSTSSAVSGCHVREKAKKIIMCLTGANRQMLGEGEGIEKLKRYMDALQVQLTPYNIELSVYAPEDVDEALYELVATEWVVQHGDLNVESVKLGKVYRTLQRGSEHADTCWQEVHDTFAFLDAPDNLKDVFCRAGNKKNRFDELPDSVTCKNVYKAFEMSRPLLRALVRAKLFSGTLSAGSGSSQITFRMSGNADISQVYSLPLGNRTPLVKMDFTDGVDTGILSRKYSRTRKGAIDLLCGDADLMVHAGSGKRSSFRKTKAAWVEDGGVDAATLSKWRELVRVCAQEHELPSRCRGLFVGISAIFYAAKAAGCAGRMVSRDDFLQSLAKRIDELLDKPAGAGRELANLALVYELVQHVLHHTSQIVCQRNWKVGEEGEEPSDFVATFTLGMYLKHSGVMGQALGQNI